MAHFRATVRGSAATEKSGSGSVKSGINVSVNGWQVGVHVTGLVNGSGADVFAIEFTRGSNAPSARTLIGYVALDEKGIPEFTKAGF